MAGHPQTDMRHISGNVELLDNTHPDSRVEKTASIQNMLTVFLTCLCFCCGALHPEMKDLRIRTMICDCGLTISRDQNAAINILREGLRILNGSFGAA